MALKNMNMGGIMGSGGTSVLSGLFSGKLGKTPKLSQGLMLGAAIVGAISQISSSKGSNQVMNYAHKYKVVTYQVLIPGEDPVDMPPTVVNRIIITKLYDSCIHPIMEVHALFPPKLYDKIIKNKNEAKIRLRVQIEAYDAVQKKVSTDDYINDIFSIYTEDDAGFSEEADYDDANKNQPKSNFNIADYNAEYIISLWSQSDLDAMRQVVNAVYTNCTISTALGKIYGQAGIKKILISPMDNQNSYAELRIPPMNLMNVIGYMERVYGTYYNGTTQFLDYRCLYIMSKNGVCDAYEKGEYKRTIFIVPKSNRTDRAKTGTAKDSQNKIYYVFIEPDCIGSISPSSTDDAIEGNNLTIVDSKNNETMQVEGAGTQRGSGNQRVITDNFANDYNKSTALTDINEKNRQVVIEVQDFHVDAFSPNKEFLVIFEDSKHQQNNGFYRLIDSVEAYTKKGDQLDAVGKLTLTFKTALSGSEAKDILATVIPKAEANAITQQSADVNKENAKNKPKATTTSKDSEKATKVDSPKPRMENKETETVVDNNKVTERPTPQNPKYKYDSLGNVLGLKIPEYNIIKEGDSDEVIRSKKIAQSKAYPCEGPRPRTMKT